MSKKLTPQLAAMYIGCRFFFVEEGDDNPYTLEGVYSDTLYSEYADESGEGMYSIEDCKLILRSLPTMTRKEQEHLIWFMMNSPIRGVKCTKKDLKGCIDSVTPDDDAIVINFSYSCFVGELYVSSHSGLIRLYDGDQEDTELLIPFNPEMYVWLTGQGFDLFGLIKSGLAIEEDK